MASARNLHGLRTSEVPDLRKGSYLGKGRGRTNRGKNTNNSEASTGATDVAGKQENGGISATEVEGNDFATAEGSILDLLQKMCSQDCEGKTELSPENEQLFLEKVFEGITTTEQLEELVSSLYEWTLLDPLTTSCVAGICATLAKFEIDELTFRSALLGKVRGDFESRDQWRKEEQTKWLSFVCLLCDLFTMMKTGENVHPKVLIEPVYSCLQQSLMDEDASDKQIEYANLKLSQLGKILQSSNPGMMDLLIAGLRTRLLSPGTTTFGRLKLLETIELCASSWDFEDYIVESYTELQQKSKEKV